MMDGRKCWELAEALIDGKTPGHDDFDELARISEGDVFNMLPGANAIRRHVFGHNVHLCSIVNGKSGKCREDCAFCAQSMVASTGVPEYPLMAAERIHKGVEYARRNGVFRFSLVTSGGRLPKKEIGKVADAISGIAPDGMRFCASLGMLDRDDLDHLKQAGISRYHHNLETAESHFRHICTTHTYADRINTVRAAKQAGMQVCAGGLFGIGESDEQILELGLLLRELDVDAVPVNFLVPISGTRLAEQPAMSPLRSLKIIALLRYVLFDKEIIVCGGRLSTMNQLHSMVFYAGASGIMTGNYLTTDGRQPSEDLEMIRTLGFSPQ